MGAGSQLILAAEIRPQAVSSTQNSQWDAGGTTALYGCRGGSLVGYGAHPTNFHHLF